MTDPDNNQPIIKSHELAQIQIQNDQIQHLTERVNGLEKLNQWYMFALDMGVTMMNLIGSHIQEADKIDEQIIIKTTYQTLERLFNCQAIAFLKMEDLDFSVRFCLPGQQVDNMQQLVNKLIEKGEFAWALQQERAVMIELEELSGIVLLHAVVAKENILGMFVAIIESHVSELATSRLNLLSILIKHFANTLDNAHQQKKLWENKRNLEKRVQVSNHLITEQNQMLREKVIALENAEKSMEKAKQAAENASRAKGDFLANMSHEIRTPMNAVIGLVDLALQIDDVPKIKGYLKKVDKASHSLLRIINDILDISKIEEGKLDLEEVDFVLQHVMDHIIDLFKKVITEKGIELVMFPPELDWSYLVGDALRLEQVLVNLVNNAIKFTEHGEIVVSIALLEKKQDQVLLQFSIQDTGLGLTAEQIPKLFKSFVQADGSTTRKYGGTGLGLSICKKIVEMMQGKIGVESIFNQGSTFFFTTWFRLQKSPSMILLNLPEDLYDLKVLIVDDSAAVRQLLENTLGKYTKDIDCASTGSDALRISKHELDRYCPYELVIIDWLMPDMDGVETLRRLDELFLYSSFAVQKPKIVLMTSSNLKQEDLMTYIEDIRVDALLAKPFGYPLVINTIREVFGKKLIEFNQDAILPEKTIYRLAKHSATAGKAAHFKILLTEDDAINQEVAAAMLQGFGAEVTIANTGKHALHCLEQDDFDAVLMDLQMPEMDGFEATQAIRSNQRFAAMPIIAMTGHASPQDRARCLQIGMNDHVAKPINRHQLYKILKKWLKHLPSEPSNQIQKVKSTELNFPSLPGIDLLSGIANASGNQTFYRKLLLKFRTEHAAWINKIQQAWKQSDKDQAHRLLHTLKSVTGNIGAKQLYALTDDLVAAIQQDKWPVPESKLMQYSDEYQRILESISLLDEMGQPDEASQAGTQQLDEAVLIAFLQKIQPHVEKRQPKECKRILSELASMKVSKDMAPKVGQFIRVINAY